MGFSLPIEKLSWKHAVIALVVLVLTAAAVWYYFYMGNDSESFDGSSDMQNLSDNLVIKPAMAAKRESKLLRFEEDEDPRVLRGMSEQSESKPARVAAPPADAMQFDMDSLPTVSDVMPGEQQEQQQQQLLPYASGGGPSSAMLQDGAASEYPREQLTAQDLLPKKSNEEWAKAFECGMGNYDHNYLESGHHVGIQTTLQTNKNPSYDLRGEPPNPVNHVSWSNQSPYLPDIALRSAVDMCS